MKDYTQYLFNGEKYGKGRLVLAVVKEFIRKNNVSLKYLQKTFKKNLQGSYGVVEEFVKAEHIYKTTGYKRHFIDEPINLNNDETVVVSNEWGISNIDRFINRAKELGYNIEK